MILELPDCSTSLGVAVNSDSPTDLYNSETDSIIDEATFFENIIVADGYLEIPLTVKDECGAMISIYLQDPVSSNLYRQYFGVTGVSFFVTLKPDVDNVISIPNLKFDDFTRYYFEDELIEISDKEIKWKGGIYRLKHVAPEKLEGYFD